MSETAVAPQPVPRDLGWGSVLPGLTGRIAIPTAPGRSVTVTLASLTVYDLFGAFNYLVEASGEWPFGAESFAGYLTLEGEGWEMTVFPREGEARAEYYLSNGKVVAASVSGQAPWQVLAQALALSPDYDAVVGQLALSRYRTEPYPA